MKGVQCCELLGGVALKNHAFFVLVAIAVLLVAEAVLVAVAVVKVIVTATTTVLLIAVASTLVLVKVVNLFYRLKGDQIHPNIHHSPLIYI